MHTTERRSGKWTPRIAALTALVVVAGCSPSGQPDDSSPSVTPRVSTADPRPGNLTQLWRDRLTTVHSLTGARIVGDRMVLTGYPANPYDSYSPETVEVVDADTGAPYWHRDVKDKADIGEGRVIFDLETVGVGGSGDAGVVAGVYLTPACPGICPRSAQSVTEEKGVVALSMSDGSLAWVSPVVPAVAEGTAQADINQAVIPSVVGSTTTAIIVGIPSTKGSPPAVVALDPANGRQLWRADGYQAIEAVPGAVLVQDRTASAPIKSGAPAVLDPATGAPRWTWTPPGNRSAPGTAPSGTTAPPVAGEPETVGWEASAGRFALLSERGEGYVQVVVDTQAGKVLRSTSDSIWRLGTDAAGGYLLALVERLPRVEDEGGGSHADLAVRTLTEADPVGSPAPTGTTALPESAIGVGEGGVAAGRIAVAVGVGSSQLVDRSGKTLTEPVDGYIRLFTADRLVMGEGKGDPGFVVYGIG